MSIPDLLRSPATPRHRFLATNKCEMLQVQVRCKGHPAVVYCKRKDNERNTVARTRQSIGGPIGRSLQKPEEQSAPYKYNKNREGVVRRAVNRRGYL